MFAVISIPQKPSVEPASLVMKKTPEISFLISGVFWHALECKALLEDWRLPQIINKAIRRRNFKGARQFPAL